MELDQETQEKIQELQSYEHTMQNILMQRQAFQMEINETENALSEISQSKEDVFKVIGNVMIKTSKDKLQKDLAQRQKLLSLRLDSIEKQEQELTKRTEELREEVMKKIK